MLKMHLPGLTPNLLNQNFYKKGLASVFITNSLRCTRKFVNHCLNHLVNANQQLAVDLFF